MDSLKVLKMIQNMKMQLNGLESELTGQSAPEDQDTSLDPEEMEPDANDPGEASEPSEDAGPSMDSSHGAKGKAHGLAILLLGKKKK